VYFVLFRDIATYYGGQARILLILHPLDKLHEETRHSCATTFCKQN